MIFGNKYKEGTGTFFAASDAGTMQRYEHLPGKKWIMRARWALVCCQAAPEKECKPSPLLRDCLQPQL